MLKCSLKSTWPCFLYNQNCQNKNKNWACIHALKCLLVFKKIIDGGHENNFCEELVKDEVFTDIGRETQNIDIKKSRESSVKQKIYNIHFLSKEKIEKF